MRFRPHTLLLLALFLSQESWGNEIKPQQQLPFAISFERGQIKSEHTLFLELNKQASFSSEEGLRFELTPRILNAMKDSIHNTVLLEIKVSEARGKKGQTIAKRILSLEQGGTAQVDDSDSDFRLSVVSLR